MDGATVNQSSGADNEDSNRHSMVARQPLPLSITTL
ncbi:hypothetical protein ABH939_005862 [Rhodococcus sp. 27YEA6]